MKKFNLIEDPWIPYINREGQPGECGILEVFEHAHHIREISDSSPLVTASIYRLLLAILHRNFGPSDISGWDSLWREGQFNQATLKDYLSEWSHRFNLIDDDYPFYQTVDFPERSKEVGLNDLRAELTQGNNSTLFDHTWDEVSPEFSYGEAARSIMAIQTYRLGGLSGLGPPYKDAPVSRAISFIANGNNLFETLMLNLVPYTDDEPVPLLSSDIPCWEQDVFINAGMPSGYLDLLTWQPMRIRLQENVDKVGTISRAVVGLGRNYEAPDLRHPMVNYRQSPRVGLYASRFNENKSLWRDYSSLIALQGHRDGDCILPRQITFANELVANGKSVTLEQQYYLTAFGQQATQAKINFWRSEKMPIPLSYLADAANRELIAFGLDLSEKVATDLFVSVSTLSRTWLDSVPGDRSKDLSNIRDHLDPRGAFWASLEVPFYALVENIPADPDTTMEKWIDELRSAARFAFKSCTTGLLGSSRGIKAVALGNAEFNRRLAKTLSNN